MANSTKAGTTDADTTDVDTTGADTQQDTAPASGDENMFDTLLALDADDVPEQEAETVDEAEGVDDPETDAAAGEEEIPEAAEVEEEPKAPEVEEPEPSEGEEATTPEEGVEALEPVDQEGQRLQYEEFMGQAEELLAQQVYQMTEEQVAAYEEDPAVMLPRLAAKVHMQAMQAATVQISRLLPQMLESIQQQQQTSSSFEAKFDEAWPDLAENKDLVVRVGQVYRQMNPEASAEDFIRDVGAQVMVATGKYKAEQAAAAPVETPSVAPHQPAGAGVAGKAAPVKNNNPFAALSELVE